MTDTSSTSSLLGNLFESDNVCPDDDADEVLPAMDRKKVSGTNDHANYLGSDDARTQPKSESSPTLLQQVHSLFVMYCATIAEIESLLDEIAQVKIRFHL